MILKVKILQNPFTGNIVYTFRLNKSPTSNTFTVSPGQTGTFTIGSYSFNADESITIQEVRNNSSSGTFEAYYYVEVE